MGILLTIRCESWKLGTHTAFEASAGSADWASRLHLLPPSEHCYLVPLPLLSARGGPDRSYYSEVSGESALLQNGRVFRWEL